MRILNFKKLLRSLSVSFKGLSLAMKEQTFRLFCVLAVLAIFFMFLFKTNFIEKIILIFVIIVVLALELINTQIEKVLNIMNSNYDSKIKEIKDISAAAVLLSCIAALIIGILIFFVR